MREWVCVLCLFFAVQWVGLYSVTLLCDDIGWSVLCVSSSWYPGLVCSLCPFFRCHVWFCTLCLFFAVPWVYMCSVSLLEVPWVGLCPVSFSRCPRLVYALCHSFAVPLVILCSVSLPCGAMSWSVLRISSLRCSELVCAPYILFAVP